MGEVGVTGCLRLIGVQVVLEILVDAMGDEVGHRGGIGAGHLDRRGIERRQALQI